MLTQARLKELIHYDPETGAFTWRINWYSVKAGDPVGGAYLNEGYGRTSIDGKKYYLQQLAFMYMEGYIPILVDHADLDKQNYRWSNLRAADKQKNMANCKLQVNNSSGYKGVSFCSTTGRWRASIRFNGIERNLGRYQSKELAFEAYKKAATEFFGEFANPASAVV